MTTPKIITEIYAWIVTEDDGSEGIPAQSITILGQHLFAPLIGADMERIESARSSLALSKVRQRKLRHRLVKFTQMTVLEDHK